MRQGFSATMHKALRKYLSQYCEPEAQLAAQVQRSYEVVTIIPACAEEPTFLETIRAPFLALPRGQRGLVIVVINAREDAESSRFASNEALSAAVRSLGSAQGFTTGLGAELIEGDCADWLVLDRSSLGRRLPARQGVGLARKVGCDLGLSLFSQGKVRRPWLYCTDADATLDANYFATRTLDAEQNSALLFGYAHTPTGELAIDEATFDYESWLRYYELGLLWAGSPYAFTALGSSIAIAADAYAKVRGFPKREAAEDFYLLNKLSKVGALAFVSETVVKLRARTSTRVPFGTGARVTDLVARSEVIQFYHPQVFTALKAVLGAVQAWATPAVTGSWPRELERQLSALAAAAEPGEAPYALPTAQLLQKTQAVLGALKFETALTDVAANAREPRARLARFHTWFDAFLTLKFVHGLERQGLERMPWSRVAQSPFLARTPPAPDTHSRLLVLRAQTERHGPFGPTV